jgi:hypothetical protein
MSSVTLSVFNFTLRLDTKLPTNAMNKLKNDSCYACFIQLAGPAILLLLFPHRREAAMPPLPFSRRAMLGRLNRNMRDGEAGSRS